MRTVQVKVNGVVIGSQTIEDDTAPLEIVSTTETAEGPVEPPEPELPEIILEDVLVDGTLRGELVNGYEFDLDVPGSIRAVLPSGVSAAKVEFYVDAVLYRSEQTAPYAIEGDNAGSYTPWVPVAGEHDVDARALDGAGQILAFAAVTVRAVADDAPPVQPPIEPPPGDVTHGSQINDTNTGLVDEGALVDWTSGTTYATKSAGERIQNYRFPSGMRINVGHNDVVVHNCDWTNPADAAIRCNSSDIKGLLVTHNRFRGGKGNVIKGSFFVARRNNIRKCGSDGIGISGGGHVVIEENMIAELGLTPESHGDGVQDQGGSSGFAGGNVVRRNNIDASSANAALFHLNDSLIQANRFKGGNITVQCERSRLIDNLWAGRSPKGTAKYGPISSHGQTEWKNNKFEDDGVAIPEP